MERELGTMGGIKLCILHLGNGFTTCLKYVFMLLLAMANFAISISCSFYIVSCETLQSTADIIVKLTSTIIGSIATYQCRDGSSDVYTTQCTSDSVWEPNPNSTLDCMPPGKILAFFYVYNCDIQLLSSYNILPLYHFSLV